MDLLIYSIRSISLLKAFLSFVFCLVVSNNSCGKLSVANIFKLICKVVPVLSLAAGFSFFSVEYLIILRLLYYIQPFICTSNNSNHNNYDQNK